MQKQKLVFLLAAVMALAFTPCAFAQFGSQPLSSHRTLGYYNSDTGLFEPLRPAEQDTETPAVTPTTGTLVFNFTITLKSALPKNAILICTAGGEVIETHYATNEEGLGIAKLESGNTYSCSISMPYSWLLATPSSDKIILSYKAETYEALQVTAENGTGVSVTSTAGRVSSQSPASIAVPANGAITTENVSITL
jgi:hypothetical protein